MPNDGQKNAEAHKSPTNIEHTVIVNSQGEMLQVEKKTEETLHNDYQDDEIIGTLLKKRYQLESRIGQGGMCNVYRAKDLLLEAAGDNAPYVAIKILKPELLEQPDAARILIREGRKTQQLSHPNIITVYDYHHDRQGYFLVMEWLDGQPLDEVIKSHRPIGLSFNQAMAVLKQVACALKHAHKQGVVHSDLKPSNIMLLRNGQVKVLDFGVSRALDLNLDKYAVKDKEVTSPISGFTPIYASPELLNGKPPSRADDSFAFCCIAYELLTSKHPFGRKTAVEALNEQVKILRPSKIGYSRWRNLKKGLDPDLDQRQTNLEVLLKQFTQKRWKPVLCGLLSSVLLGISGHYYWLQQQSLNLSQATVSVLQDQLAQQQSILELEVSEFLQQHNAIPPQLETQKQAWLQLNREKLLDMIELEVDELRHNRVDSYPNYYAINAVLQRAYSLYPDSYALTLIAEEINQGWARTIEVLTQRLDKELEQGNYQLSSENDDIYALLEDLHNLSQEHKFMPNNKAVEVYATKFDDAMRQMDVAELAPLIKAGKVFFKHSKVLIEQIESGKELQEAIIVMADYHSATKNGVKTEFPYQAADIFYKNKFEILRSEMDSILKVSRLNSFTNEVNDFVQPMPNDFAPLIELRQELAKKYLRFTDILINKRRTRDARKTMQQAQDLMSMTQNVTPHSS